MHTGEKPFSCTECNAEFRTREQLKLHVTKNHAFNPVPETHRCPFCPKKFAHSSGLSRHLLAHSGVTFDCAICLKSYKDQSTLRRHMNHIHKASSPGIISS